NPDPDSVKSDGRSPAGLPADIRRGLLGYGVDDIRRHLPGADHAALIAALLHMYMPTVTKAAACEAAGAHAGYVNALLALTPKERGQVARGELKLSRIVKRQAAHRRCPLNERRCPLANSVVIPDLFD